MPIQIQGAGGSVVGVGAESFKGMHVVLKPTDYSTLGHYRIAVATGTMAAALAAGAIVFSARWGDGSRFCVIKALRVHFLPLTAFTANTLTDHTSVDAFIARSFTASHTGGTALTITGDNQSMRASMGASLFTDMRISTTAALGGGTLSLDAHPFAAGLRKGNRANPSGGAEEQLYNVRDLDYALRLDNGEHPIVLAQNEGIVVRNRTVWPAAGTGMYVVEMVWAEVLAY